MKTVGSFEAKTHLPQLIAEVERGESITITRNGKPVAILSPVHGPSERSMSEIIAEFRAYSKQQGRTLGGIPVRELIEEGRR